MNVAGDPMNGFGPEDSGRKEVVCFRAPPDIRAWLQSKVAGRLKVGTVAAWAVAMGREYVDALEPHAERLAELSEEDGLRREALVARVLELGLRQYEKDRRGMLRR